jgi:hypothetical protein
MNMFLRNFLFNKLCSILMSRFDKQERHVGETHCQRRNNPPRRKINLFPRVTNKIRALSA